MKTLLIVSLVSANVYASDLESFGTGFMNGLNQAAYGYQQYQQPQPVEQPVYNQPQGVYMPARAPFCVTDGYSDYCNYYSLGSCESAAKSLNGLCAINPNRGTR